MTASGKQWWTGANRVLLVNLREGDEPKIDARRLVADVKSFGATAFCINGGGIVAFYQTRIAGHRISNGLGGRDLLVEIIPVAHEAGLQFAAFIKSETTKWGKVVKASGQKPSSRAAVHLSA